MQFRNLPEDGQIEIYFETCDSDGVPVAPSSAFTASDFAIYKNGSATAKATTNGITVTSPFNSEVGTHSLIADTSNDTGDAGFWEIGGRYQVKFNTAKTVDGKSIDGRCVPRGAFGIQSEYMRGTNSAATGTNVSDAQAAILAKLPSALVSGRMDASVGAYQSGMAPPTTAQIEAALLNEGDGQALIAAIIARIETDLDGSDLSVAAIATAVRNAVLDRVLSGNHDTAGSTGKLLQDAATSTALAAVSTKLGTPAGASVSADIAAVKVDTSNLASRITSTLFSGITQLSRWLGALAGKTADSTTLTEIQATTAGAGYNNTTDSLEALRDRGDVAWITGSTSGGLTSEQNAALNRIDAKAALITGAKLQVVGAVTPGGDIRLVIGDDHIVSADSELSRTIADTGGALYARLNAADFITFGAGRVRQPNMITGTVTATYASNVTTLTIEIGADDIDEAVIPSEDYTYQIQRVLSTGEHVVEVEGNLTLLQRFVSRLN